MTRHLSSTLSIVIGALLVLSVSAIAQDAVSDEIPAAGEPLAAGRYADDSVGPVVEIRVEDGWRAGPSVDGPIIMLESTQVPGGVMTITRFDGDAFVDSCDPTSRTTVDASVQRIAEIIGANPLLRVAPPVILEVDGYRGIQLDVGVPAFDACSVPFLLLWAVPGMEDGEFVQVADQQSRFIALDVSDEVIVIAIESFPGVPFGSVLDASMDVVDSMRITPASEVTPSPEPSAVPSASPATSAPAGTPEPTPMAQRTPTPLATDPPDA